MSVALRERPAVVEQLTARAPDHRLARLVEEYARAGGGTTQCCWPGDSGSLQNALTLPSVPRRLCRS